MHVFFDAYEIEVSPVITPTQTTSLEPSTARTKPNRAHSKRCQAEDVRSEEKKKSPRSGDDATQMDIQSREKHVSSGIWYMKIIMWFKLFKLVFIHGRIYQNITVIVRLIRTEFQNPLNYELVHLN